MSKNKTPEFILLSNVVNKLKDKDYYQTFAKTLIMTNRPDTPIPSKELLVKEMFQYFIESNNLKIYLDKLEITAKDAQEEAKRRSTEENNASNHGSHTMQTELENIWEKEIYINVSGLKKLYANKCIVFPNSLLKE